MLVVVRGDGVDDQVAGSIAAAIKEEIGSVPGLGIPSDCIAVIWQGGTSPRPCISVHGLFNRSDLSLGTCNKVVRCLKGVACKYLGCNVRVCPAPSMHHLVVRWPDSVAA